MYFSKLGVEKNMDLDFHTLKLLRKKKRSIQNFSFEWQLLQSYGVENDKNCLYTDLSEDIVTYLMI